jgi:predicted DsbA family dithiol-disulfide isomerase
MQAAKRQNKEWEMAEKIFANMRQLEDEALFGFAEQLGMDVDKFKADFASDAVKKEVADDIAAGRGAGVRGTPTLLINGIRFRGQRTLDGFKAVIDPELKKADELIAKGTSMDKVYETLAKSK